MEGPEHESSAEPVVTARSKPNILITGTPGTGKSSLAAALAEQLGLTAVDISELAKEKGYYCEKDQELDTFVIDEEAEDRIVDELEPIMSAGGVIVEAHSVGYFPERWFDLVLVLRADTAVLFDRLTARKYSSKKVEENVECEIMQVVLEDARENYAEDIVHELPSNTMEDLKSNIARTLQWATAWAADH